MYAPFRCVVFVLLLLTCSLVHAQHPAVDSLKATLDRTTDSRQRVLLLHQLASQSWDFNFEEGHRYADEGYGIALKSKDNELLTIAATDVGLYYYFVGNYTDAERYYAEALKSAGDANFGEYPAYTLTRMGNLYRVQGKYDTAKLYYNKTLQLLEVAKSPSAYSSVYHNIAWLHYELSEYDQALLIIHKSLSLRKHIGDSLLIAECWKFLGTTHRSMSSIDSAEYYLAHVKRIATTYTDPELLIFHLINEGELSFAKGDMLNTIKAYQEALEMLSQHKFKRYQALTLKRIGQVYDQLGDFERSNNYFLQALSLEEELQSIHEVARSYALIGWGYAHQRNYDQADQYAKKSIAIMRHVNDKVGIAYVHNLMGTLALEQKEYANALIYFDSALSVRRTYHLAVYEASTLENKGYVFEALNRSAEALAVHQQASAIYTRTNNLRRLAKSLNNIGVVYLEEKKFNEAERFINKALYTSMEIKFLPEQRDSYFNLAKLNQAQGKYKEAVLQYDHYVVINDSLFSLESIGRAAQAHALYDLEKKEQRITTLNLENQQKEQELVLKEIKLRSQTLALIFAAIGVLLLLFFVIMLYKYYLTKKKANEKLEILNLAISEQKEEIQTQSEELKESYEELSVVHKNLQEKQEEIEAQTEELREANEAIFLANSNLEKKVAERTQQLRQAYLELDTFFYRSSHDFRRPLTTFMGLAEVAKITLKDPNAIHLFEKVKETAINLDKMLMKLQSISDVGLQQLSFKELYFRELVDTILVSYQSEIERKGLQVVVELEQTSLVSYPSLLKIVLENLTENAINFCKNKEARLIIRSRKESDRFILEFEDNGLGIDPEYQSRIFEMYFRANSESKGNGLGLYIVKKAVEKLNGEIFFTSQFNKGSTFTIDLPNRV